MKTTALSSALIICANSKPDINRIEKEIRRSGFVRSIEFELGVLLQLKDEI
jgi:hypothetical protein